MKTEYPSKRARRRAYLNKVRREARLKAEAELDERRQESFAKRHAMRADFASLYRDLMVGEGRWRNGGCRKAGCGLCQPMGRSFRDLKHLARLEAERREYFSGRTSRCARSRR